MAKRFDVFRQNVGDYIYDGFILTGESAEDRVAILQRRLIDSPISGDGEVVPLSEFPVEVIRSFGEKFPDVRQPHSDAENRELHDLKLPALATEARHVADDFVRKNPILTDQTGDNLP